MFSFGPSLRLPFHLDTILIPFACISMGDGIFVLADVPSVQCATTDETFVTMFGAGQANSLSKAQREERHAWYTVPLKHLYALRLESDGHIEVSGHFWILIRRVWCFEDLATPVQSLPRYAKYSSGWWNFKHILFSPLGKTSAYFSDGVGSTTNQSYLYSGCCAMMVFSTGFSWLIYCIWCSPYARKAKKRSYKWGYNTSYPLCKAIYRPFITGTIGAHLVVTHFLVIGRVVFWVIMPWWCPKQQQNPCRWC